MTFKNLGVDTEKEKFPLYGYINNQEDGVSSSEITEYLNAKNKIEITNNEEIEKIRKRYENAEIIAKDRDLEIDIIIKKNSFNKRTVQRCLNFLTKRGFIVKKNNRYRLSKHSSYNIRSSSHSFGQELLLSLMKMHTPLYNTLEENIDKLITLFGSYTLYCLLVTPDQSKTIPLL